MVSSPSSPGIDRDGEYGWGAEGVADAATLAADTADNSVSGGFTGGRMGGMSTGKAVAGTSVLVVIYAGLKKLGLLFWAPSSGKSIYVRGRDVRVMYGSRPGQARKFKKMVRVR